MCFDVCVIGAGIVGLSTALNVQRLIPNVKVTIIADNYGSETNTPVTQNLFIPAPWTVEEDVDLATAKEWFWDGWRHHYKLATKKDTEDSLVTDLDDKRDTGNELKKGVCLWYHPGTHVMHDAVLNYRTLSRAELDEKEYRYAYGCEFTTVHIDQTQYLRWLLNEIRGNGGEIYYDTVCSFQELYGQYDAVVNCVGKRGRELVADNNLVNIRGTMVQTTPVDLDDFLITQDKIFVCQNKRTGFCDIGFLYDPSNKDPEVNDDTSWLIKHRAYQLVPELKDCKIVNSYAERRVERYPIRLEIEFLDCGGPILPIVHNIGHGDNAVSLAWGRGYRAAILVQDAQRLTKPFAKKWHPYGKL